ncbi:hypothetical protein BDN71DRAFT_600788 [Pleurotus eryngii]|uniref:DNA 3'-5' helicase n=1 Tax=Pleurotus eryngii TaxID=5323 RepID=A0A9P5ZG86_PLEER|nr:hypothetical protein BDN71DRAFT_600788 [Pleurotus eryngii]
MDAVVYRRDGLNVLVVPFTEMFPNYLRQAQVHGIQCKTWPLGDVDQEVPQLLLTAISHFTSPDLHEFLVTAFSLSRLERVTVEEAHLMPSMAAMQQLVDTLHRLPVPLFVTSSACPQGMQRNLLSSFGRKAYDALRCKANDLNISFQAYTVTSSQMIQEACARISAKTEHLNGPGCALLYCQTSEECDRMAGELGWLPLHASVPVSHRDDTIARWKSGNTPGLVCDTALGYCLNSSSVRYVFHFGAPRNVVDYIASISELHQSNPTQVIIFFDPSCLAILRDSEHLEAVAVHDMLADSTLCMRIIPGILLHGSAIPCVMLPGAELCTACEAQLSAPLPLNGSRRFPFDLAQKYGRVSSLSEDSRSRSEPFSTWATPESPPLSPMAPAGYRVQTICRVLESACMSCWLKEGLAKGKSHRFGECSESRSIAQSSLWKEWVKRLRLPVDCCYFCGISLTMECDSQTKGGLKVHSHSAHAECPWAFIFKPLAYLVQHDAAFWKRTTKLSPPNDQALYQQWLVSASDDGMPVLVALLLLAYESTPLPSTVV